MTISKPEIVYLGPDDELPEEPPGYVIIERDPEGSFNAIGSIGSGFNEHESWEIYSDDDTDLERLLERASDWVLSHGIGTIHVRMKVKGWEYSS